MAVIRWDPFSALARMDTDFDELVRRSFGTAPNASGYVPAIDMLRDGGDVIVTLELPGVDIERDVEIEVAPRRLVISGERRSEHEMRQGEEPGPRVVVREQRYGAFRREFALPEHVKAEDVEASYDRGLLTVRVHNVTKPVAPPTKISIGRTGEPVTLSAETITDGAAPEA
jgi:HSP20 family protein